jgi:hypothetical protein
LLLQSSQHGFKPLQFADFAPEALVNLENKPKRCAFVETGGELKRAIEGVRVLIEKTVTL